MVRFALLGDVEGVFLSDNLVPTAEDGTAETQLTVLSVQNPFGVRAAAGTVESMLRVVTVEASAATLLVKPNYRGKRAPQTWVASVHLDQTCAGLQGVPYPDGVDPTTSDDVPVRLDSVPADRTLAVVIRAEQLAGGCRGVSPLLVNSETTIEVDVYDRPMQIADLGLDLSFSVEAAEELNPGLRELAFRAASALNSGGTDLAAVLDVMSALSGDSAAFDAARASQGWAALLSASLTEQRASTGLREKAQSLMHTGLWSLYEEDALAGRLSAPGTEGTGSLTLESVIGLAPELAGFEEESSASVLADSEDYLRIGATLSFRPSQLMARAATLAAIAEDPARASAAEALADEFDCVSVADQLVNAGTSPGEAFGDCDEACVQELCAAAMDVLWARVEDSELPSVPWQFSGAARASVDADARPELVSGTWVGSLNVPDFPEPPAPVQIQGPFVGSE